VFALGPDAQLAGHLAQVVAAKRVPTAGQGQGVHGKAGAVRPAQKSPFRSQEAQIEGGVVSHQHGPVHDLPHSFRDLGENRLVRDLPIRDLIDGRCAGGNRTLRIDQTLEVIQHLAAAIAQQRDLTDPVAQVWVQSGGFHI